MMKNFSIGLLLSVLAVTAVHAQTVAVSTSTQTKLQTRQAVDLPKVIAKGNAAISARITALNSLSTRISGLKNVSATEKTTLSTEISSNINGLMTLQAKIDADTDLSTATADNKSIFDSFRIYALVIPQGYIAASVDRIDTITSMLSTVSTQLQTRITADTTASASLQSSLTDMNAKIADANTQAAAAQSATASLKAARVDTKAATSDLQAARQDAQTIINGLK
jgi:chromosome segregation ATPase